MQQHICGGNIIIRKNGAANAVPAQRFGWDYLQEGQFLWKYQSKIRNNPHR